MSPKIAWLEVQGFRSFGELQRLDFAAPIGLIWGPNSQGKTSLAEAIEFLFTGAIVRRALSASSQDEFSDSLRNAHLKTGTPVFVRAGIETGKSQPQILERRLLSDFAKKADCQSALTLDGAPAKARDLEGLGITLSQPPIAAPILMQHTLSYVFSARPQDRSTYFKALLEVTDLDELRNAIAAIETAHPATTPPLVEKLRKAATSVPALNMLNVLFAKYKLKAAPIVSVAAEALLKSVARPVPPSLEDRLTALRSALNDAREKTFRVGGFDSTPPTTLVVPATLLQDFGSYASDRSAVEADVRKYVPLFAEALRLPELQTAGAVDCPLCAVPKGLTPERVERMRETVAGLQQYQRSRQLAQTRLGELAGQLQTARTSIAGLKPKCLQTTSKLRKKGAFTPAKMRALLPAADQYLIEAWLSSLRPLLRAARRSLDAMATLESLTSRGVGNVDDVTISELGTALGEVDEKAAVLAAAIQAHNTTTEGLKTALKTIIDAQTKTTGWQDFLDASEDVALLDEAVLEFHATTQLQKELGRATKDIERAKAEVLNAKFNKLSTEIQGWWELLRPQETTFFSEVRLRSQAQRTIDFKAALAPDATRKNPSLRDVIAVFSHSQLNCLGLAAFLAKACREKSSFVVLDDPILTSDEDHRTHFMHSAVKHLIEENVQVIVLTQDDATRKDLTELYSHLNIDCFQISLVEPATGSLVEKKSDSLSAMLQRARPFLRNALPEMRKIAAERLRDAAERFCKEFLVRIKRGQGNTMAAISDYDGKMLPDLRPLVEPHLTDPAHPGKLKTIANTLNPGNHDDKVPNQQALAVCWGDLEAFRKQYVP